MSDHQQRLEALVRENERFRKALKEIAGEDYRGNRPHSATVAYRALNPDWDYDAYGELTNGM